MIKAAGHYCPLLTKGTVVTASLMSIIESPEVFRETGNVFTEQIRADCSAVFFRGLWRRHGYGFQCHRGNIFEHESYIATSII